MFGADIERLRGLARGFDDGSVRFEDVVAVIDAQIMEGVWVGPDAESFAETWNAIREQLLARAQQFRDMAVDVRGQAHEQEVTSAGESPSAHQGGSPASFARGAAPGPSARPVKVSGAGKGPLTPDEIFDRYQVSESPLVDYEPKWPGSLFTDPERLSETEANILYQLQFDRGLLGLNSFKGAKEDAVKYAGERFPEQGPADGHQDAFRHAMWNALLTDKFGEEWAEDYGTAHEQQPNNRPASEAMDLYNNEVGRRIAAENPDASTKELADLVEKAVRDGEMVVIGPDGNLVRSNEVPPGGTGIAPEVDGGPKGKDPDFNTDQY